MATAFFALKAPSSNALDGDSLVRGAIIDQNRAWIRWLVTIVVSGFLFAYVSAAAGALWLVVTLALETVSAWTGARLANGDRSMGNWRVATIAAVSACWIVHAVLLWSQRDELAHIAALMDLFTLALYGAIGGRQDKRVLAALVGPPLVTLGAMLITYAWTQASAPVAIIATLATLGACATIAVNALEMHRSDRLLLHAHADLRLERDSLGERVAERTHELREARLAAEAASRAKSVFLRTMSHELRTPLNGILGYAEILAEDIQAGEARVEDANNVALCGRRLLQLVNDVLDLASLESGHAAVHLEEADIEALINAACKALSETAVQNANALRITIAPDAKLMSTDARRLLPVLRHVIDNACKFTTAGVVAIDVRRAGAGRTIEIEVTDTGAGMASEDIERLLAPFEQASQGVARSHEGAGLGLAITQRMLALLKGRVHIESAPGQGTRVLLSVPG